MMLRRRTLLKTMATAAGAVLLQPFYSQLARAGSSPSPKRFVFITEGNCFEPVTVLSDAARNAYNAANAARPLAAGDRFWPNGYAHEAVIEVGSGAGGSALTSAPALGAFGTDMASKAAVLLGLSSRITGGGHSVQHGTLSSSRTTSGRAGGITIDALLGATPSIRQDTPFDVLRVGVLPGQEVMFNVCAFGPGKSAPMSVNPVSAFNTLFSSVGSPESRTDFAKRRRLLDFATVDVTEALRTFSGGSRERQKLETYLASLEEMISRHQRLLGLEGNLAAVRPEDPSTNPLYQSADPLDHFRAQLALVGAALQGGLTNVAVVAMGPGGGLGMTYDSVLSGVNRHNLHHGSAGDPTLLAAIHEVTRQQVAAIATLAHQLEATPDVAGGTMLDNTAIVFISDNGEQHHSTATDFPTVVLGGSAMGLRTEGRTLLYPGFSKDGHRQVSNLWNTVGHLAGLDLNDFGAEGRNRRAAGPLSELLG